MTLEALLGVSIATALLSCLVAVGARTLREYSRHDLEELCERRNKQELFRSILRDDDRVALSVQMFLVLGGVASVVAGALTVMMQLNLLVAAPPLIFLSIVLGLSLPLMLLWVWLPWSVSRLGAAKFLLHTWPLWQALNVLATPLGWCARLLDALIHRLAGRNYQPQDEESFEEEIRTIVSEGQREGLLEEEAREMIEGIMDLGDAEVSQIMTPRTDMHIVQVNMPWDELLADVIRFGHTRVPVYDKNRDDIIGILYSKDLLPELCKGPDKRRSVCELLRKPLFVPETKPVDDLLEMFQQMRTHIAIVLDEYGGVSGLVTIEDALEEIVGEIVDEYDREVEDDIKPLENGAVEALGRAHVDEINEAMGTELPEDGDYDTIGGFVFAELGRVPLAGEELVWRDAVQVTILDASRRRINRVRIQRIDHDSREIA